MTAETRINDDGQGFCVDHDISVSVTFIQGSSDVFVNNQPCGGVNAMKGQATCGHSTIATTGSSTVFVNNNPIHRIGDTGSVDGGNYSVTSASPNVFANS